MAEETKDLNVKGIERSVFERWQEAARAQGRSLSNWVKLELERAAASQDAENERLADEATRRGIALRSEG